ncbi:MAG: hypothetical protein MUF01_10740 [Bryobacterales bacterium]|jgi:hypothetical protein|nr:hypothetical protein [Bryobacterales bacterium]
MIVDAVEPIRKMRGGAQAWLVRAGDGCYYVLKLLQNAQHSRILINEWLCSHFLLHLQLCAAQPVLLNCTREWMESAADLGLHVQRGTEQVPLQPGLHFGSRVPVDPNRESIYDFLPDAAMDGLENRSHYHGMLAFDQWVSNADTRQSVYFRGRPREFLRDAVYAPTAVSFLAMMIDHGYAFQGPDWRLDDLPRQGLYPRPSAYVAIRSWDDLEPWLSRIQGFSESAIDEALKQIPSTWYAAGEERELERLLEQLLRRRQRVPDLLHACRLARPELFPNWRSTVAVWTSA